GEAMLGSALLAAGGRRFDEIVSRSGLRAVEFAIRTRRGFAPKRLPASVARLLPALKGGLYPFSMVGILDFLANGEVSSAQPAEIRNGVERVARHEIRRAGPLDTRLIDRRRDTNRMVLELLVLKSLESVRQLDVVRSEAPSAGQGTVDPLIETWSGEALRESEGGRRSMALISDRPDQPNAYHAFTAGNLARMIRYFEPDRRADLEELLRRAVRMSRALSTPDGDLAWAGRTTMLGWTLSYTAYAALAAANTPECDSGEAAESRGFAALLLDRLRDCYLPGASDTSHDRLCLVPALQESPDAAATALDPDAAEISYSGTTLLGLEWAAGESGGEQTGPTDLVQPLPTETPLRALATVRTDQLWFGVRGQVSTQRAEPRYDLGPVAASQRTNAGWQWLLHPRPRAVLPEHRSWLQLIDRGRPVPPRGHSFKRSGSTIEQEVIFTRASDESSCSGLRLVTEPSSDCNGMRIELEGFKRPLQVIFWLPDASIEHEGSLVRAGEVELACTARPSVSQGEVVAGSTCAHLAALRLVFQPSSAQVSIDLRLV
ncbi:MAG: hypothetical protein ACKOBH_03270, partial [bacterium]